MQPDWLANLVSLAVQTALPLYAGQYRLVPRGLGAFPNRPRSGPSPTAHSLEGLLDDLGIQEADGGHRIQIISSKAL